MVPVVPIWNCLFRMSLTNQSFNYSEKILPGRQFHKIIAVECGSHTFIVVSIFFTSPVMSDSEKSIFELHNCVRKARRR